MPHVRDEITKLEKQLQALKLEQQLQELKRQAAQQQAQDAAIEVEEIHEETRPVGRQHSDGQHTALPAASRSPYALPAAIMAAALIIGGAIIFKGKDSAAGNVPQKAAAVAAGSAPAAPQPQAPPPPAPDQKVDVSVDDDPFLGPKDAPVTIVAFEDFQCPFCGRLNTDVVPQLIEKYVKTGKLRYVYRDYPLPFHQYAQKSHEAAECADEQGKFWDMHKKLYANQSALDVPSLKKYAGETGLNQSKFDQCLDSGKYKNEVQKDYQDGSKIGVSGTPTLYINGRPIVGAQPLASFTAVIDEELKKLGK